MANRRTKAGDTDRIGGETILLIEDDDAVRSVSERALECFDYTVLSARNGPEALRLAANHAGTISLVVTDVVMPGMRGTELAVRLRSRWPGVQVLLVSGYAEDPQARRTVGGRVEFMAKPFGARELAIRVRDMLEGTAPGGADPPRGLAGARPTFQGLRRARCGPAQI